MDISRLERWFARASFSTEKRQRLWQTMAVMLESKLGIDQILAELYDRASENGEKPREAMAIMLSEWQQAIRNGGRLTDAVEGWVPHNERMIIMAGEDSGNLPRQLHTLIAIIEAGRTIRSAIVGGTFYPAILLLATLGYLFVFGMSVIPKFTVLVDPAGWRPLAKSLYYLSQFTLNYGLYFLAAVITPVIAIVATLPSFTGNTRVFCDRLPPWSIYRLVVGAGFMHSLSALLRGGGRIKDALVSIRETATPYLAERIDAFLHGVHSGMNAGEAMRHAGYEFPSKEIVADLTIYAKYSSDFGDALEKVSQQWMKYGLQSIQMQMKVLNGAAIALMGLVLAWIVAGFFGIQNEIAAMARGQH